MTKNAIVIFSDDFRIKDNPALFYAAQNYENIIPLFVFDKNYQGRKIGGAAKVFLHYALESFSKLLRKKYGVDLVIKKGNALDEIAKIVTDEKISAIYFNDSYTKKQIAVEEEIKKTFQDLDVKSFTAKILFEPFKIRTGAGAAFKVFTPFSKECLKKKDLVGEFLPEPKSLKSKHKIKSDKLDLLPKNEGDWHLRLIKNWEFDYEKIANNASDFLENKLQNYKNARNMMARNASNLSPYFRFGMISVRIIFNAAQNYENHQQFVLELLWREFAYHTAFENQEIAIKELKPQYGGFQWENDAKNFKKWQKGETGFDAVDAGMKEIWQVGVMHGRARMISASFLVKDLLIDWRKGEQYFWDCLVDADACVNPFSWQWIFGSGFDAAPYFRIFNPELQRERFDPKNEYCRKWLGDRSAIEKIVDHGVRRKVALERYKKARIN